MKKELPFIFFLLLLFLVTAAFFGLIKAYLLAVFWSVALALLFNGLHQQVLKMVGQKRNLAAAITLSLIILAVIIPTFLIGQAVVTQAIDTYERIESGDIRLQEQIDTWKDRIPALDRTFERFGLDFERVKTAANDAITNTARKLTTIVFSVTQNVAGFVIQFFLMLYVLYFFLRDGRSLLVKIIWVIPISDRQEWLLVQRFESVTRATIKGSLVVAIIQGGIGGVLFWSVGIPAAALWGVVMTILSLLPLGSGIVWIPAALIFFSQGAYTKAIVLLLVGSLIIGLVDNFLRPRLVGSDTKLPDYLILLSTLGGLAWFGVSGFILGPIIAALFITCWSMIGEAYGEGKESAESTIPKQRTPESAIFINESILDLPT